MSQSIQRQSRESPETDQRQSRDSQRQSRDSPETVQRQSRDSPETVHLKVLGKFSPSGSVPRGKSEGSPHNAPQYSVATQGTPEGTVFLQLICGHLNITLLPHDGDSLCSLLFSVKMFYSVKWDIQCSVQGMLQTVFNASSSTSAVFRVQCSEV